MHVDTPHMVEEYETDDLAVEQVMVPMEMWKTFIKAFSHSSNSDQDLSEAFNLMVSASSVYEDATTIPFSSFRVISMFDDIIGFFEQIKGCDLDSVGISLNEIAPALDMMYSVVATLDSLDDINYYDVIYTDKDEDKLSAEEHDSVAQAFFRDLHLYTD